jgi:hypothetical protein
MLWHQLIILTIWLYFCLQRPKTSHPASSCVMMKKLYFLIIRYDIFKFSFPLKRLPGPTDKFVFLKLWPHLLLNLQIIKNNLFLLFPLLICAKTEIQFSRKLLLFNCTLKFKLYSTVQFRTHGATAIMGITYVQC